MVGFAIAAAAFRIWALLDQWSRAIAARL